MRAGKLDRTITISSRTTSTNAAGKATETLVALVDVRAQIISASIEEAYAAFGSETTAPIAFRIRYLGDLTLDHVVSYGGQTFDIVEITEIGRRRGLEIRCKRVD